MKQAVFHGQEMWIGIADVASGTIRETHTLEEAKRADFHTCFYFSEESEKKHENKDGIFFWVQDGKVELEYNDLSPYEKTLLETQIKAQVIILDQDESVLRKTMLSERQENNNRDGNRMQIQILYSCNEWKEHSSMKIVCATTNPEVLYALIGESIKAGDMEYGCEDKEKGWELFQQDYGKQQIRLELLQYGFVESMPNLSISDKTSIRNYSEVYLVYTALHNQRAEEILRPLHLDRQCLIYSMADVHSDYGSNQIILSGFGKEEALRASELFEAYESNEDYLELKVEVRLCITLHSKEQRIEQLKGNLSMDIEGTDLTAAIRIFTGKKDNENGYFGIEPRYLETWGKTFEEVYQQALQNMPRLFPPRIMEMDEMIGRLIFGLDDVEQDSESLEIEFEPYKMYVLSNDTKTDGTAAILYPGLLEKLASNMQSNIFILPSSEHETLLTKDTGEISARDWQSVVIQANQQLFSQDILSDEVYCYDYQEHMLKMVTDPEQTKELRAQLQQMCCCVDATGANTQEYEEEDYGEEQ